MTKRIEFMSYCKEGEIQRVSVRRERSRFRFYRKLTEASMQRFENLQEQSNKIMFSFDLEEKDVELQISMFF